MYLQPNYRCPGCIISVAVKRADTELATNIVTSK